MTPPRKKLGELLVGAGLINESQLRTALSSQKTWGGRLGSALVRLGYVREEDLLRCLSGQLRLPSVDFGKVTVSPRALQLIPLRVAEKYNVLPVAVKEEMGKKSVILAMADPTNTFTISEIQFQTGVTVRPVVATESAIARAIDEHYRGAKTAPSYGYAKTQDLSRFDSSEEMVILQNGDERVVGATGGGVDALELVRALIRTLKAKGLLSDADVESLLRSR